MTGAPLLAARDLAKSYRDRATTVAVLDGAALELHPGEVVSLMGPSGAGKSTLLELLAGLMVPDAGSISFDGVELAHLDEAARAGLRARRIGVVMQRDNLVPFLSAQENVQLARGFAGAGERPAKGDLLAAVGLDARRHDLPRRLSGGEAMRAALAVALANAPDLLLADEITAELDAASAERVLALIHEACRERGLAALLVTHSDELAARADRRLRLAEGRVLAT